MIIKTATLADPGFRSDHHLNDQTALRLRLDDENPTVRIKLRVGVKVRVRVIGLG